MSWVTNLVVIASRKDRKAVEQLSDWLRNEAPHKEFDPSESGVGYLRSLTTPNVNQWGGWKNPECDVWGGALNHADINSILEHVRGLAWTDPDTLQLLIMDQEETYFRLWMVREGRLQQYAPESDDR